MGFVESIKLVAILGGKRYSGKIGAHQTTKTAGQPLVLNATTCSGNISD